ncbi:MAG: tRNA glutamyl-Q(34) synthetase GluQRS [Arcanobacterium sp.]|nr:tRNA glutamyl-Q(34) synthetase GluQRS [Arcanobacterium sp.]
MSVFLEFSDGLPEIGRYAPSPSGQLHLGNLRTALLAWAYARKTGRGFRIRVEDLDARSRSEYESQQLRDLELLGLDWDGSVVRQSERLDIYQDIFSGLEKSELLYECFCTRKELAAQSGVFEDPAVAPHYPPGSYRQTCRHLTAKQRQEKLATLTNRGAAYRLKTNGGRGVVWDLNFGQYHGVVDDFVIRRGDGVFSYNFVSVVDDALMGVTQIVRGDDLLSSAPRQAYLLQVLGARVPEYAHVPLVLNDKGERLSKRDGAVSLAELNVVGVELPQVLELLSVSLGFPKVSTASEFLSVFQPELVPVKPWVYRGLNV